MPRWIIVPLIALALAACQQNPASIDYNPDTDFRAYQSYTWASERSGTGTEVEPLLADRVQKAVSDVLERRGYRSAEGKADFQVRYFLAATAETRDTRSRGSIGVGGGGGNVGMGVSLGFPLGGTSVKEKMQLTIDLIDSGTGKLTWRAVQEIALPKNDPEAVAKRIREAVENMMGHFPPETSG